MTSFKNQALRRELIMKHYSNPENKSKIENSDVDLFSKHCVDEIHIKLDIKDNIVKDAKFDGEGCAIFLSSTDIMMGVIKNKTIGESKIIVEEYEKMINGNKEFNESILNELLIFENVGSHFNRVHCAEMVSNALKKIL